MTIDDTLLLPLVVTARFSLSFLGGGGVGWGRRETHLKSFLHVLNPEDYGFCALIPGFLPPVTREQGVLCQSSDASTHMDVQ